MRSPFAPNRVLSESRGFSRCHAGLGRGNWAWSERGVSPIVFAVTRRYRHYRRRHCSPGAGPAPLLRRGRERGALRGRLPGGGTGTGTGEGHSPRGFPSPAA